MKSIKSIAYSFLLALVVMSLFSCHDDDEPNIVKGERTIICYMPVENTLYENVQGDIDEMVKTARLLGENDRIVIYYDGLKKPMLYVIDKHTEATSVNSLTPVMVYDADGNSCSKDVMASVFNYICKYYPANSYGLICNTHGTSWLPSKKNMYSARRRSFGVDNGKNIYSDNGDEMRIVDFADAVKCLPHLEFIMLDLCYMQSIEVAYQLRSCADYIIGSPSEVPAEGAPYTHIMPFLMSKDVDYGSVINVYSSYHKGWRDGYPESGVALSVVRCSKLDTLREVTHKMTEKYGDKIRETESNGTVSYLHCNYGLYRVGFYDMKDMMRHMMDADDYAAWLAVYDEAVPYSHVAKVIYTCANESNEYVVTDPDNCGGLAMSLQPVDDVSQVIEEYESLEWRY